MGRPPSGVHDYLQWQSRLERFESGDLDLSLFCLQEGTSRSTFYRWKKRLEVGIAEPQVTAASEAADVAEAVDLDGPAPQPTAATFLPISLKAPRVEIELPNGGMLRLPPDIGQNALISIVKVVGSSRPWKAPPA